MTLRLNDWFCGAGGATQGAHAVPGIIPTLPPYVEVSRRSHGRSTQTTCTAGFPNLAMVERARDRLTAALAPPPKPVCTRDGCDRPRYGKGLCDPHYRAARRAA